MGEVAPEHSCRSRSVDIVVPKDRDFLGTRDGIGQSRRRCLHIGEDMWIRHKRPHRRVEEARYLGFLHAAAGKNARQKLGQPLPLRDRKSAHGAALVEPIAPGAPACGSLDAQKYPPARAE
jgi:hypothetical protein